MRTFVLLAALAALSACSQASEEPTAEATPTVAAEQALTVDGVAGAYDYTRDDGTTGITTLLADGSFTDLGAGGEIKGQWSVTDNKVCIDPEGESPDRKPNCYTLSAPDAEGMQIATGDDGTVVKVTKKPG
jgi:opacity protein-like surface antigen